MTMAVMADMEGISMYLIGGVNRCSVQFSLCEEQNVQVLAALNWNGGKVSNVD